jgi:hypothetical protein
MAKHNLPDELINHLCRHSSMTAAEACRLVTEVLSFYNENLDEFIRRRHSELRAAGLANSTIFDLIRHELPDHRFLIAPVTERQIRRVIYG